MRHGKTYRAIRENVPQEAVSVQDAVDFVKQHHRTTFDETVEIHIRLGVDPQRSEQMVRGSVVMPGGSAKQKNIVVFAEESSAQKKALDAGAGQAGGDSLIAEVAEKGDLDADIAVATPEMMKKLAKIARILGPKGLMPNPKTGTVSADPAAVVTELMGGKLSFKMDQLGHIHESIGRVSWEADKLVSNVEALVAAVRSSRPAAAKGEYMRGIVITTTMGPAVRLHLS